MPPNDVPRQSWSGLKNQAANGTLKLDDTAIADLRNACDAVIGRLLAIKREISELANIKAFAPTTLPSSNTLAQKYVTSANNFGDIVQRHLDIQNDMMDTFIAAGKAYINAEVDSSQRLDRLAALSKVPPVTKKAGDLGVDLGKVDTKVDRMGFHGFDQLDKSKIKNPNGNPNGSFVPEHNTQGDMFKGAAAEGENPDKFDYQFLYRIGQEIDHQTPGKRAGQWDKLAGVLDDVFTTFNNKIGAVANGEKWGGDGAGAAKLATDQYVTDTQNLRAQMRSLSGNLAYTSGWLALTMSAMPQTPTDRSNQEFEASSGPVVSNPGGGTGLNGGTYPDQTPIYRENFKNTYLIGLPESDTSIPSLPQPTSPIKEIPDPTNTHTRQTSGGPGPGPGPGPRTSAQQQQQVREAARRQRQAQQEADRRQRAADKYTEQQRKENEKYTNAQRARARQQEDAAAAYQREMQEKGRKQADAAAAYQREMQEKGRKQQAEQEARQTAQQAEQAAQQAASQAQQALEKAMAGGEQGLQQAMSAAQQAAQQALAGQQAAAARAGIPGMPKPGDLAKLGGGGAKPGGTSALSAGKQLSESAKLFPRASAATTGLGALGRAGAASPMAATPGSPGPAGAAGRGADGGQGKNHKRPAYLESVEHMDGLLGDAPRVVRPVVEQ
ncbi:hypothetical protein AB0L63_07100 [Nocardia sp. NPDC051990]|uniref:hypothetical protein n=1 Tax=Nocardia sp. NPDC051990 TaxID=3155285 RepID=UPI00343B2ACA